MPFEINRITIRQRWISGDLYETRRTRHRELAVSYQISAFTHPYHAGYGGPEVDQRKIAVTSVTLASDGLSAKLTLQQLDPGFVYEFDLGALRSATTTSYYIVMRSTMSMLCLSRFSLREKNAPFRRANSTFPPEITAMKILSFVLLTITASTVCCLTYCNGRRKGIEDPRLHQRGQAFLRKRSMTGILGPLVCGAGCFATNS